MPKRKRDNEDAAGRSMAKYGNTARRLQAEVANAHKQLSRAFKLAKGFERQKLGRRRKAAAQGKNEAQVSKVDAEVEAWKSLEPGLLAAVHFQRLVMKEKALRSSANLTALFQTEKKIPSDLASTNISARLFNSNPVKTAITDALSSIRAALGIRDDSNKAVPTGKGSKSIHDNVNGNQRASEGESEQDLESQDDGSESSRSLGQDGGASDELDEKTLAELSNGRLAPDSDSEDSVDVATFKASRKHGPQRNLSVTPPGSEDDESEMDDGDADTEEEVAEQSEASDLDNESEVDESEDDAGLAVKRKAKATGPAVKAKPGESSFMPTLSMGGYISGSESEASSIEEQLKPRKNRRGQRARQAIWEMKFGKKAKHLQEERAGRGGRDAGWDARKGATGGGGQRGKEPWRPAWARDKGRSSTNGHASGGNATAVRPGRHLGGQPKSSNDNKPLHPSWEAKLKAKQKSEAGSVAFAGKKVTFD